MNFEEALVHLKNGKKIGLKFGYHYYYLHGDDIYMSNDKHTKLAIFYSDDVISDDWEIVED